MSEPGFASRLVGHNIRALATGLSCLRFPFLEKDIAGLLYFILSLNISNILMKFFFLNGN